MQLDLNAVWVMAARLIHQHMTARHQEEFLIALKEEPGRIRERMGLVEGSYARRCRQNRFDHLRARVRGNRSENGAPPRRGFATEISQANWPWPA